MTDSDSAGWHGISAGADKNRLVNTGRNLVRKAIFVGLFVCAMGPLLGIFTTAQHARALGIPYLEYGKQVGRYHAVLDGNAGDPWQYRVLAPYTIRGMYALYAKTSTPHRISVLFILFRVVQDSVILLLSVVYYRKLGLSLPHALIGMLLLAWGMSYSHYDSDLQFSLFFDVIFYLLAALCILHKKFWWIVPITLFAALNRETSGLIPVLLLCSALFGETAGSPRTAVFASAVAFVVYAAVFVGLRLAYGGQEPVFPHGHHPGFDLLRYNVFRLATWEQLVATVSVIPLVALMGYREWPRRIRVFFWVIVPTWGLVHLFCAVMAESRLFLVPQALVFIPGVLFFAQQASRRADSLRTMESGMAAAG